MNSEKLAKDLFFALRNSNTSIDDLRIFLIGETHILRVIDGDYTWALYAAEYGYATINKLDRGEILSSFAKLEFLVNECINIYFLNTPDDRSENLSRLIKSLPFRRRVEALKNYNLINASIEKKLKLLSSTRNTLAHEWNEKVAKYDKKPLTDTTNFETFNRALETSFGTLVEKYKSLQEGKYHDHLLEVLKEIKGPHP